VRDRAARARQSLLGRSEPRADTAHRRRDDRIERTRQRRDRRKHPACPLGCRNRDGQEAGVMAGEVTVSLDELRRLLTQALVRAGTSAENAGPVAAALAAAEADGQAGHGVSRLPSYADQVASGKVDGRATPVLHRVRPGAILVDARCGFAYPAIARGLDAAAAAAAAQGVVAVAIANSHHFGVAGYHVERMADRGLVALAFGNSPAAIAPWGGRKALFGTNPIAFACPRRGADGAPGDALVIDLSLSKV